MAAKRRAGSDSVEHLRDHIRRIERRIGLTDVEPAVLAGSLTEADGWSLGDPAVDGRIGVNGLQAGAVHEIRPRLADHQSADWASQRAAARSFALLLAIRRLACLGYAERDRQTSSSMPSPQVLWCTSSALTLELGALYGPGLRGLGLDPASLLIVDAPRQQDALWALEEGLKANCLALTVGEIDEIDLTPARRLALAAARFDTPCLIVTHPRAAPVAATATRWRIGRAPSAAHPFDEKAPGAARFEVGLERCRGRPSATGLSAILEWCDAAYRFHLAAAVADRADAAGATATPFRRRA